MKVVNLVLPHDGQDDIFRESSLSSDSSQKTV